MLGGTSGADKQGDADEEQIVSSDAARRTAATSSERAAVEGRLLEARLRLALVKRRAAAAPSPAPAARPAKRQAVPSTRTMASHAVAQVVLGGAAYSVSKGGRSLHRFSEADLAATRAAQAATAAGTAAAHAMAAVHHAVECNGSSLKESTCASKLPGQLPQPKLRHVSIPKAVFEVTSNGMGLQRRVGRAAAAGPAEGRMTIDFRRQRQADEARAAKGEVLCYFFCRHGRCSRDGAECLYEHDPACVSICQPFIHGECQAGERCALSHDPAPERMPVCRLFLRGLCVTPTCAFSHVHLGDTAELCVPFSRGGYCPIGAECTKRHEMPCDSHAANGQCVLGERCRFGRRPLRK